MTYQRLIAIHDICGLGHASLACALPVLAAHGHQAIPLPTSILSTQTDGFSGYTNLDLTANMAAMISHWQDLHLQVDAVYSGYLASPHQADLVKEVAQTLTKENHLVLVDPVLGDNGTLYDTMGQAMIDAMRDLVTESDCITPNLTELLALSDLPLTPPPSLDPKPLVRALADQGPAYVVVTSAPHEDEEILATLAYDRHKDTFASFHTPRLPAHYPGTGDLFAATLCGYLMDGEDLFPACQKTTDFMAIALQDALALGMAPREGIPFERALGNL